MRVCAIVPQKSLALAKGRLRVVLRPEARAALSLRFLRIVCGALRASPGVEQLIVMTPDPRVLAEAGAWGVRAVFDPRPEVNAALAAVLAARVSRTHAALIVAGDLPLLRPADIAGLLSAVDSGALGVAPAKDGTGTNALLIPAGVLFRPAYGDGSLAAHRRLGRALGLRIVEVARPGLAFDVDTPEDLAALGSARSIGSRGLDAMTLSAWRI